MIDRIDHIALTVASLAATCWFYENVLGFATVETAGKPTALLFGRQKINLHETGHMFEPKAEAPTPGSADLCLVTSWEINRVLARLAENAVAVELGPVPRDGALGPMTSIYFRDPDRNPIEVSRYIAEAQQG